MFTRTLRYPPKEGREKGVDVQIAIDLVTLAIDNEYDLAVLASADTDLLPALDFVVQRHSLKMVECVAWEPLPGCEARTAAPLDSRSNGVIRRTIPHEEFDRIADRHNYMLFPSGKPPAAPGQSARQLPTSRRRDLQGGAGSFSPIPTSGGARRERALRRFVFPGRLEARVGPA